MMVGVCGIALLLVTVTDRGVVCRTSCSRR
jgi:hypothetical protein